jgi:FkbM family methyltransferase
LQAYAEQGEFGKWTYQTNKLMAAMRFVRRRHLAVDVGGHCGLWSKELVELFDKVIAFEPVQEHRECFRLNVHGNYDLHACALGEQDGMVNIHTTPGQSGDSWVEGEGDIPMTTLDSFEFEGVDFIKLDCEGYELFALRGGEKMLKRDRPVVIVEQKPGRGLKFGLDDVAAVGYLMQLGYTLQGEIAGDYILSYENHAGKSFANPYGAR